MLNAGDDMRTRIRDLREDADLTQQQVAEAIGITQRKYSYLETEVQPLTDELLVRLGDFYRVSVDYILRRTDRRAMHESTKRPGS